MKRSGVGIRRFLRSGDDGQIIVLSALIITIVLGMGALAVDAGFYLHERQNVQKGGRCGGAHLIPLPD
jgi:Flp pilus assembly protein TadG